MGWTTWFMLLLSPLEIKVWILAQICRHWGWHITLIESLLKRRCAIMICAEEHGIVSFRPRSVRWVHIQTIVGPLHERWRLQSRWDSRCGQVPLITLAYNGLQTLRKTLVWVIGATSWGWGQIFQIYVQLRLQRLHQLLSVLLRTILSSLLLFLNL